MSILSRRSLRRKWAVYEATGNTSKPLRLVACIRTSAKSIAVGTVHRARNIPKRELVADEGCPAARGRTRRPSTSRARAMGSTGRGSVVGGDADGRANEFERADRKHRCSSDDLASRVRSCGCRARS